MAGTVISTPAPLTINASIYAPSETKPGFSEFARTVNVDELAKQVKHVLQSTPSSLDNHSLLDLAESVYVPPGLATNEKAIPRDGSLLVMVDPHSEGLVLRVAVKESGSRGLQARCLIAIKFLCNDDDVWLAARKLTAAIHAGT